MQFHNLFSLVLPLCLHIVWVVATDEKVWGEDIYSNGPYFFAGCKPDQGAQMHQLFIKIGWAIEQLIWPEAKKGSASPAFKTFFSSNSADAVAGIFSDITNGAAKKSINQQEIKKPAFVCVNDENQEPIIQRASWMCSHGGMTAFIENTGPFVFLCPKFRARPEFPFPAVCPKLNGAQTAYVTAAGGRTSLTYNQMNAIIHELGHVYAQDLQVRENEDINHAITASADFQLGNPFNFATFSSCEFLPHSYEMIKFDRICSRCSRLYSSPIRCRRA